jgi:hypothetical protein
LGLKEEEHSAALAGKMDCRYMGEAGFSEQTFLKRLSLIPKILRLKFILFSGLEND